MDWIERVLGVNPDGGTGSVEIALSLSVAMVIASTAIGWSFWNRKRLERG